MCNKLELIYSSFFSTIGSVLYLASTKNPVLWQQSESARYKAAHLHKSPSHRDFSRTRHQTPALLSLKIFPETKHYFFLRNSCLLAMRIVFRTKQLSGGNRRRKGAFSSMRAIGQRRGSMRHVQNFARLRIILRCTQGSSSHMPSYVFHGHPYQGHGNRTAAAKAVDSLSVVNAKSFKMGSQTACSSRWQPTRQKACSTLRLSCPWT